MADQQPARAPHDPFAAFPAVRIINLPHRADRRAEVTTELARLGATIDGRHIAFHAATRPADAGGFETIGTHGCFLSHLDTLRQAHRDGVSTLLLLEDDVAFSRSECDAMRATLAALADEDWDIFYGGSPVAATAAPLTLVAPETPVLLAHFVAFSARAIAGLVPYLEAMLTRPIGSAEGGPMHVDGAYGWFRAANPALRTFAATPHIAHQRASRTDIHRLRGLDRFAPLRPLLRAVRAGKNLLRQRH